MFCSILLVPYGAQFLLAVTAAESACQGEQCAATLSTHDDGSTAGSVMLQVTSAKSAVNFENEQETDEEYDLETESDEEDDLESETGEESEEDVVEADQDNSGLETSTRDGKGKKAPKRTAEDEAACPSGGRLADGACWHVSLPATSCEETCVEKDLQYDEATDMGTVTKTNTDAKGKCLGIAAKFGYPGKEDKLMQWGGQGCGCVVYKVPAYGLGDEVRLNHGKTNAKCAKTSTITSRLCACKKAAAIGDSCTSSSGCAASYCKAGTCTKLVASGSKCTEHASCTTGYCSPTEGACSTLAWKVTQGAFAQSYRKSGKKRLIERKVPNWERLTTFPKGFCLGYYAKTTGCMIAKGINRAKTIAKAQERCAVSAECRAVWCCATACPATTCYATKAQAPNHKAKDCPDAPGSFHETKYPNTFYIKDAPAPEKDADSGESTEKEEKNTPSPEDEKSNDGESDEVKVEKAFARLDADGDGVITATKEEFAKAFKRGSSNADESEAEEEKEETGEAEEEKEETSSKIYKQVKPGAICRFARPARYTNLKGERTVDDCAEAVKQRSGLGFAWLDSKKRCLMAPKPWSECPQFKKGKWDLYELEAGGTAGDDELKQDD